MAEIKKLPKTLAISNFSLSKSATASCRVLNPDLEIKAIIFDAGGVYLEGNFTDFVNKCYKLLGINKTFSTKEEIVFDEDFNKGKVGAKDCFLRYFGVPITDLQMQEIIGLWKQTWKLAPEMKNFVDELNKKHYILAILSNSDIVNTEDYKRKGWYKPFRHLFLSHEVGILKPDKRIYELAQQKLRIPAESCVFIDDQEKNLAPAIVLGMKTIPYTDLFRLKIRLKELGVKC